MHESLHKLAALAIEKGIATSVSIGVSRLGEDMPEIHVGVTNERPLVATDAHTMYDLASLTKIIGTSLSYAIALHEGRVRLSDKPFEAWPNVTIKMLLGHTSGLIAHRHFYDEPTVREARSFEEKKEEVLKHLFQEVPSQNERVYSDSGYIALGAFLEKLYQMPLSNVFARAFLLINMPGGLLYFPSNHNELPGHLEVAPTGRCVYRQRLLRASVNDLNCYVLGGLAGHAGLFGRLRHVMHFGNVVLQSLLSPRSPYEEWLKYLATHRLGFDNPSRKGSNRFFSPDAVGHFGYTGTSLWIDKKRRIVVAVLTNRVQKSHRAEGIYWLRENVHRVVVGREIS